MMRLNLDPKLADGYRSGAQRARRLTEGWFAAEMFCVACGAASLRPHPNNSRTSDFSCAECSAKFELKGGRGAFGTSVPDGAFDTMMERLERAGGGPHLALLRYCPERLVVRDLMMVPSPFLTRDMILRRPALPAHARRAGWVGCNIRIADVPDTGRIAIVHQGVPMPRPVVVRQFRQAASIIGNLAARTWLVDTLRCVERLPAEFALSDLYAFEPELQRRHPGNRHVRPKLRQQLQRLRDAGLLTFLGDGRYRRSAPA